MAADIPAARAFKTVDLKGLYVAPGLIDIHVHTYGRGFTAETGRGGAISEGRP